MELESYFEYCFRNDRNIFFYNLTNYISEWNKDKINSSSDEVKYIFAEKVKKFLKIRDLTLQQYLGKQRHYIPIVLQHYLAGKEIPFELIIYLKTLDKCDIDKKKLKMLLHREMIELSQYKARAEKLRPLIEGELRRIIS